jgi:aminoglycoside phosphotransferase (APT) family kinase protein
VAARRLRFVHRALAASRHGGFAGVPVLVRTHAGATIVRVRGALHDAQEWVAGAPLSGPVSGPPRVPNRVRAVPPAVLTELAGALAAFHASTEGLAAGEGMTAFPLATLLAEVGAAVDALARAPTPATRTADEMDLVARWFDSLPRALRLAERVLARHPGGASDAGTLCHGDLWPGHVFAAEGTFRGFVDFESIGFASPATDLAHLLLHFGGWDAQEEALTAYERVCALPPGAVACLPAAVALDAANEGAWALSALLGRLSKAQRGAHLANLRDLHGPLDAVLARYG